MKRRRFIEALGTTGLAAALPPGLLQAMVGGDRAALARYADFADATLPPGKPILVSIFLDGGNDALNTLVPVTNPHYYDVQHGHGAIAIAPGSTLPLTGLTDYGLHPKLGWLASRWTQGDLAFVQGIGEPSRDNFSHFDSMKMWQTANAALLTPSGWLGRYNDIYNAGNPYASMSMYDFRLDTRGVDTPSTVLHRASYFYLRDPDSPVPDSALWHDAMLAAAAQAGGLPQALGELVLRVEAMSQTLSPIRFPAGGSTPPYLAALEEGSQVPFTLAQVGLLIRADVPCQTYSFAFGSFDFHSDLLARQEALFVELDRGLRALFDTLAGSPRIDDVIVLIWSEFGRQVTANFGGGTDHGRAGLTMVLGGGVKGGLYGVAPSLEYVPGYRIFDALPVTTDFRSLYAPILAKLAGDAEAPAQVLGAKPALELAVFDADLVFKDGFDSA